MPSGFPEDVEPLSQSVADVERSKYKAAWREAMKSELDGHKTTGIYEAATPPRGRKPVDAKWVFSCKTNKDGMLVTTKARLVAKGFSQFLPPTTHLQVSALAAVSRLRMLLPFCDRPIHSSWPHATPLCILNALHLLRTAGAALHLPGNQSACTRSTPLRNNSIASVS